MEKPLSEYHVGEVIDSSYARTVTETHCVTFTGLVGLLSPVFLNEEFCKKHSIFKTRVVPGLLTASFGAGMLEGILGKYTYGALGADKFRFTAPLFVGDTLRARITVIEIKDTKKPDRGVLTVKVHMLNQKSELVLEWFSSVLMRKHHFEV